MDGHLEPPSPARSPDMSGLDQMIGHHNAGAFLNSGPMTRKTAGASPRTHTHHDSSPAYHGTGDFGKTSAGHSFQAEVAYTQPRPYTTPETSSLTASQPDAPGTRATTREPMPSKVNSRHCESSGVSKTTPKKGKDRRKAGKQGRSTMQRPLTELAAEYPNVAILDIATYVRRPREVRLQELARAKKDPGKIKRPMNSFMLYRKAYQNVAKALCGDQHHEISRVAGDAWNNEPVSVRKQFKAWANIENANHRHVYPEYKFAPKKSKQKAEKDPSKSKVKLALDDLDQIPEEAAKGTRESSRHGQDADAPASILGLHHPHLSPDAGMLHAPGQQPLDQYRVIGAALASPYDSASVAGLHYNHQHGAVDFMPGGSGLAENVMIRGTPSPAAYGAEPDAYHGRPSQYPPFTQQVTSEQVIDPSLDAGPEGTRCDYFYGAFGVDADRQWQGHGMPESGVPVLPEHSTQRGEGSIVEDPQLNYLHGDEASWQLAQGGQHNRPFDGWATT